MSEMHLSGELRGDLFIHVLTHCKRSYVWIRILTAKADVRDSLISSHLETTQSSLE